MEDPLRERLLGAATGLQQRLSTYFAYTEPAHDCHAVTRLLTVRDFLLQEADGIRRRAIRAKRLAGPSGTTGCTN